MRSLERPDEAALISAATQRWIEAAVDERVQRVLASTKSLSDWVATTCQQGAEASRITAAALHESEEARRHLEADVRRLAEQQERFLDRNRESEYRELKELNDRWNERFTSMELRLKSKESSDQSRDEEFSSIVRDVQSIQLTMQRLESQWEKANSKFNKFGLEVASTSSAASIWEGQCRSAQALLESRLESISKSLSDLESGRNESLERMREEERQHLQFRGDPEAKMRLEKDLKESCEKVFVAVEKRCNDLADQVVDISKAQVELQELTSSLSAVDRRCAAEERGHRQQDVEQRRSVENLQRRMQSMQVALETIAELRQEDRALSEEMKIDHERFRQKLGDKMSSLELGLGESVRLEQRLADIEVFLKNFDQDMQSHVESSIEKRMKVVLQEVKGLTKDAARELREEVREDFHNWVTSWDSGFEDEMPNIERTLRAQLGHLKRR
ncbi:unnamed protein product [Durusdinium trenchii]|uniref:Uncharacterized protein n=1 Tax=Durusdinium trenchii TaxID=1381693 RepID=A0ABP0I3N0_9DINO